MIFGDGFEISASTEAADWLDAAPSEDWYTAGWLVTTSYPAYLRCYPPDPDLEDWRLAYREFFEAITGVGARHTSTAGRAWFGIWEGHGFPSGPVRVSWSTPAADDAEEARRQAERAQVREESLGEMALIQAELDLIPRFEREGRAYYLLSAALAGVSNVRWPGQEYGTNQIWYGLMIVHGAPAPTRISGPSMSAGAKRSSPNSRKSCTPLPNSSRPRTSCEPTRAS